MSPCRFERQLRLLARLGYEIGDLEALHDLLQNQVAPPKQVVLTFDDGFADLFDHVLPIVGARKIAAVVSVVSDRKRAQWTDWGPMGAPGLRWWRERTRWSGRP